MKTKVAAAWVTSLAGLLVGLLVAGQDVPYEAVAPELRPVDAFGAPLAETVASDTPLTSNDIGALERELESMKERYLIQQGWVKNPDNPGSLWLWSKTVTVDDRTRDYRLETDVALSIEYLLEPPTDEMLQPYVEPIQEQ